MHKTSTEWEIVPSLTCPKCNCQTVYTRTVINTQYLSIDQQYHCKCGHEWEISKEVG